MKRAVTIRCVVDIDPHESWISYVGPALLEYVAGVYGERVYGSPKPSSKPFYVGSNGVRLMITHTCEKTPEAPNAGK